MECKDRFHVLSLYLDGVLSDEKRGDVEGHLKTCAECRDELAALRNVERRSSMVIQKLQVGEGFVKTVMKKISGRRKAVDGSGSPVNWPVLVALLAATMTLVVVIGVVIVHFAVSEPDVLPPLVGSFSGTSVEVTGPDGESILPQGNSFREGWKAKAGARGACITDGATGARVYLAPGSTLEYPAPRTMTGAVLPVVKGDAFVRARMAFAIDMGRGIVRLPADSAALVSRDNIRAIAGRFTVTPSGEKVELGGFAGESGDVRDFAPSWVPAGELAAPWPCVGGSSRASGWTPLIGPGRNAKAVKLAPVDEGAGKVLTVDGDGTAALRPAASTVRADGTVAVAEAGRIVLRDTEGRELKSIGGIEAIGAPLLAGDDEPIYCAGAVIRHGESTAGPLAGDILTGPAADGKGVAYAIGKGYLLGLGADGELVRLKVPGIVPVRPTVAFSGEVYFAAANDIWKLSRPGGDAANVLVRIEAAPSCQMLIGGEGRVYCATVTGKLLIISAEGSTRAQLDLGSPAESLAIGRGRELYALCNDGTLWKVSE